jgi:hypothetical protein
MLALAYSNDTLDIYHGAVCYMFYRFFEHGVGMVWVRILLPKDFDEKQISAAFKALKMDQQRSFDYWSARSRLHEFAINRHFREFNNDLNFWRSKSVKDNLIPRYQMRGSLRPVIVYNEPELFSRSIDCELARVYRNWLFARLFASNLRKILINDSDIGYDLDWLIPKIGG